MNRTKIEWTHAPGRTGYTWNPITGCRHGCGYCYARPFAKRLQGMGVPGYEAGFEPTFHPTRILEPTTVKQPGFVFTVSMGDMFGHWVPFTWINDVFSVAEQCPQHVFAVLTKNPSKIQDWHDAGGRIPDNVWLGVSVTTMDEAWRISVLWSVPGTGVRFVSLEPIRGPVDREYLTGLDWLIVGSQTGAGAPKPDQQLVNKMVKVAERLERPIFVKANTGLDGPRQWPGGVS